MTKLLIDRLDRLTLLVSEYYFPQWIEQGYGAPKESSWRQIFEWCLDCGIECNRGRGTTLRFHKETDVTAFMLKWS